jgi:nitrogen regulatory protein PII
MPRLHQEKMVTVITTDILEDHLTALLRKNGVSGYTIISARGAGASGEQSGMLSVDANIKLQVVIPEPRLEKLLDCLDALLQKGYHLTVFVADVAVMRPEKYESHLL